MMYNVECNTSSIALHYSIDKITDTEYYYLSIRKPEGAWKLVEKSVDCDALVYMAEGLVEEAEQCM